MRELNRVVLPLAYRAEPCPTEPKTFVRRLRGTLPWRKAQSIRKRAKSWSLWRPGCTIGPTARRLISVLSCKPSTISRRPLPLPSPFPSSNSKFNPRKASRPPQLAASYRAERRHLLVKSVARGRPRLAVSTRRHASPFGYSLNSRKGSNSRRLFATQRTSLRVPCAHSTTSAAAVVVKYLLWRRFFEFMAPARHPATPSHHRTLRLLAPRTFLSTQRPVSRYRSSPRLARSWP